MIKNSEYNGWTILDVQEIDSLKAKGIWAVHNRTKMEVFHLLNDDSENLFAFGFKTLPTDSKGAAHILEHSVLCGSKNYPLKDPFIRVSNQSIKTYLNALTFPDKTVYPGASQIEKDYFNLMSVYGDAVFFPLLKKEIFAQEAHHFEVDEDNNLSIQGVVYNEMKGNYSTFENVTFDSLIANLLPNTPYAEDSGGNPVNIPEITHEELKNFHKKYYSPSNCKLFLAGNIPTEKQLDFVSEKFLSELEPYEVNFNEKELICFDLPRTMEIKGPYSEENKKSTVSIAWVTGKTNNPLDYMENMILEEILIGHEGSPLAKALLESKLGEDISPLSGSESSLKNLIFVTGLRGVKNHNVKKVEKLVLKTIENLVKNGIPKRDVETAIMSIEFSDREIKRANGPFSLVLMRRCYRGWMNGKSPFVTINDNQTINEIKQKIQNDENYIVEILKKRLLENKHRLLVNAKGNKKYNKEFEKKLKTQIIQNDNEQFKQKVKITQQELHNFQEMPDSEENLKLLPHIKVSELKEETDWVDIKSATLEKVPYYYNEAATNGISYLQYWIPLDILTPEEYKYITFYVGAITSLGFNGLSWAEGASLIAENLGSLDAGNSSWTAETKQLKKYGLENLSGKELQEELYKKSPIYARDWITFRLKFLEEKTAPSLKVFFDLLNKVSFTELDRLKQLAFEYQSEIISSIIPCGNEFAATRSKIDFMHCTAVQEIFTGLTQVYVAKEIVQMESEKLAKIMQNIHSKLLKAGACINATATENGLKLIQSELLKYLKNVEQPVKPAFNSEDDFISLCYKEKGCDYEWFDANSNIGFAAASCPVVFPTPEMGEYLNLFLRWFTNTVLWEKIRTVGGAYGARASLEEMDRVFVFTTYRDPQPDLSLKVFVEALTEACEHQFSDEEVERTITGYYSNFIRPNTPRGHGNLAFMRLICDKTKDEKLFEIHTILNAKPKNFHEAAVFLLESCKKLEKAIIYNKIEEFAGKVVTLPL